MKFTTRVLSGQGRGKTLGFPTFNLHIPANLKSKPGIYAGYVWINHQKYLGAFHYGPIPIFNQPQTHLEVFILDFSPDYPTSRLTFELVHYLRPIRNFSSSAALSHQISLDVKKTAELLS